MCTTDAYLYRLEHHTHSQVFDGFRKSIYAISRELLFPVRKRRPENDRVVHMTRPNPRITASRTTSHRCSRRLRFDVLEDRRLLAGVDVFVFDDLDSSRFYDASKDGALSGRAVYVDLNGDSKLNASEPWAVSDSKGIASFPNLEPGTYSVRLLGSNKSVEQTFPTRPADQGVWSSGLGVRRVLGVESSGTAWGFTGSSLIRVTNSSDQPMRSIGFDSAYIMDAIFEQSIDGVSFSGFVLTRNLDQSQVLWKVNTAGAGTKQALNLDVNAARQLVSVGDRVLVVGGLNQNEISIIDTDVTTNAFVMKNIGVSGLPSTASVREAGGNGFVVLEDGPSPNRLSLYQLNNGVGQLIGKRSFASKILTWQVSSDNASIAVSTEDDFVVLRSEAGLPTNAILPTAVGPIVFDSVRNLLITGNAANSSELTLWSTSTWTKSLAISNTSGRSLTNATLSLNAAGTELVVLKDGDLYQQKIAAATAAVATVVANRVERVQIGLRHTGNNTKPELLGLDAISVDEDGQLELDASKIRSRGSDRDGDSVVYLVQKSPNIGQIHINQDAIGTYRPSANANGHDAVSIQAYDGRDWSVVQVLPIVINPVNDLPSDIGLSTSMIEENPRIGSALVTLTTLDPDADSDYQYVVNDPRFSVDDGVLRLVRGNVSYEDEPIIVLAVTATNRLRSEETIVRSITISIRDVNDAPTGINAPSRVTLPELTESLVLGRVNVIDQDTNELYSWVLSDSRFEVLNGVLKMTDGSTVDFETEPTIAIVLRGKDNRGQFEVEKTISITVTDQDDEPAGLNFTSLGTLQEGEIGTPVGSVSVIDPDRGEVYSFNVSDNRFEVVGGVVKLRPGAAIRDAGAGFLELMVTATSIRSGSQTRGSLRLNILTDETPHHNDKNPYDVDGDGRLTPLDPLIIINHINDKGIGPIDEPGEGESPVPDLDVDGDGEVTPLDILILINKLNEHTDDDFSSPESEGEGEGVQFETRPLVEVPAVPVSNVYEVSLESYLSELSEDVGPRRFRRK